MLEDDWDLRTYHKDIQKQYEKLSTIHDKLKPFRAPLPTESETIKGIFNNLRDFMRHYQWYFDDFVDQEIRIHQEIQGAASHKNDGRPGKLTRGLDPLLGFSQRLIRGLKDAEAVYDDFEESLPSPDSYDNCEIRVDELLEPAQQRNPFSNHTCGAGKSLEDQSSKRSSDGEEGSDQTPKRPRVTLSKLPLEPSISFSSRTIARTKSAPERKPGNVNFGLFRKSTTLRPFSRTDSTTTESTLDTEFSTYESCSTSASTSVNASRSTTPFTSLSSIPSVVSSYRFVDIKHSTSTSICEYGPIKITSDTYVALLNTNKVNFYVQWELERLIAQHGTITWGDFETCDLTPLKNRSAMDSAAHITQIIQDVELKSYKSQSAKYTRFRPTKISDRKALLLAEVDKEEASILAGDLRGVGNDSLDWPYGGKIQYTISVEEARPGEGCTELRPEPPSTSQADNPYRRGRGPFTRASSLPDGPVLKSDNPLGHNYSNSSPKTFPFEFTLRRPDRPGKSSRLARRYGSRRVISLKIGKSIISNRRGDLNKKLKEMLVGRCLIVLGRPYRVLWATADQSVFLVESPEQVEGVIIRGRDKEPAMPTFQELLKQYNDLSQKPNQAMAKWAARPQILFSDSIPAAQVELDAIQEIPDIVTAQAKMLGDAKTEQILTDGCGLMSESLAQRISHHHSLTLLHGRPSVVQMRIGGSKGLLALMSPSQAAQYPGKEILLRDSMIKALPAPGYERDISLQKVDLLCCESLKIGATLTSEVIIAMEYNGVPRKTFVKMAQNELDSLRDAFLPHPVGEETENDVLNRVYNSCYGIGGVGMERKKRIAKEEGRSMRAAGLAKGHGKEEVENDETDDPLIVTASELYGIDPISGQPGSIGEALMEAIASGYHPATSPYTATKLHHLVATLSNKMIREFKIPVTQSLTAFIIPDSLQVLAPDELFICFSGIGPIDESTNVPMSYLEGDVLGYRSPCKVPTDVRKFKAVYKPELTHLKGCIVLSANSDLCKRSPASYLGGGDYDGDTLTLFWGKELVDPFKNADDKYAETPENFEEENFHKSVVKGTEFLKSIEGMTEEQKIKEMQEWLLGAVIGDELTGRYSELHANAVYTLGYAHPETIRLARMFCHVLDARKSGLIVKPEVWQRDSKTYNGRLAWRIWKSDKADEDMNERNTPILKRGKGLRTFIMDILMNKGEEYRERMMGNFLKTPIPLNNQDYIDSKTMWEKVNSNGYLRRSGELDKIEKHVRACYEVWAAVNSSRCGDVFDSYENMLAGKEMKWENKNTTHSPVKQQSKIEKAGSSLEILTQKRQLAFIWKSNPPLEVVPSLNMLGLGEDYMRELKLSFLSTLCVENRQTCSFDLDFDMTCAMKAKASGKKVKVVLSSTYESLKPSAKASSRPSLSLEQEE